MQPVSSSPALPCCAGKVLTAYLFTLEQSPNGTFWHLQNASHFHTPANAVS